jgi:hypothetical protein
LPTVNSKGDLTATGGEDVLIDDTTNKWFSGYIDLENMASGDTVVIKTYIKVRSTGVSTLALWSTDTYVNAQTTKVIVFAAPMPSDVEFKITLTQTVGTFRVFPWKFYES